MGVDRRAVRQLDNAHAGAQFLLGLRYANGEGVPENNAEAVKWYRLAAEQGHANAQYFLGAIYADGEGVAENDAEAVKWFRKAAEQGDADSQSRLGLMYDNGEGVPENDAEGTVKLSRICPFCGKILLDQRLRINGLAVAAGGENAAKLLNLTVP